MIEHLYYPVSPYEFSVLPADILGHVYERFLGKVIRLTPGRVVKIEEKPEVRKAGGVFYTPTYIVDYIVRETVGPLLEGKAPLQIGPKHPSTPLRSAQDAIGAQAKHPERSGGAVSATQSKDAPQPLRILDPACGSGSFLLGAYQFLLDWHLQAYLQDPERWLKGKQPPLEAATGGSYRLSIAERKRILMNNIYGVDIDPQAVEVTKLSLLLKVLEGEAAKDQMSMQFERVLPDLERNIKCGNSLIGCDFYEGRLQGVDEDAERRVNAFDWEDEFKDAMASGGFDAVIGNPPYVRQEELSEFKGHFQQHYETFRPTADLYVLFIELGHRLLRDGGLYGMIVSNKWLRAAYGEPLRRYLTTQVTIREIVDFAGLPVFEGATVRTIIILSAKHPGTGTNVRYLAPLTMEDFASVRSGSRLREFVELKSIALPPASLLPAGWSLSEHAASELVQRLLAQGTPLKRYLPGGKTYFGVKTGLNEAFVVDCATRDALIAADPKSAEILRPLVAGRDVQRYHIEYKDKYLILTEIGVPIHRYPAIFAHLKRYQSQLEKRWDKGNIWWELRPCDYYERFSQPKIIYPDIAATCRFTLDRNGYFGVNTTYFLPGDDLYLLGLLNSKLAVRYFSHVCAGLEGGGTVYLRFFGQYLDNFPVRTIDFADPADVSRHDRMVTLVTQMLDLHTRLAAESVPQEKTSLQRRIDQTDRQIERLVYELYGLTEAEIKVVEGS